VPKWLKKLPFWILGISTNYHFDWQYVIAASRMNSALSLATLFSIIAIVTKFTDLVNLGNQALYLFISAVVIYALALVIIRFRAPVFLQEYADFKAFDDKKHSHRWALWELHTNLTLLKSGFGLLPEAVEKKLCVDVTTPPARSRLPTAKAFTGPCVTKTVTVEQRDKSLPTYTMCVHQPLNFDRDLIMGFTLKSSLDPVTKKFVLAIREGDTNRDLKVKELFWMILTAAAKENVVARWFAWAFVRIAVLLLILAIIFAVTHTLTAPPAKPSAPCCFLRI
jgi:hypothetical protein